jgi:hypothetical protein
MPTARSGHVVGVIAGVLYAAGGNAGTLLEAYDIATNTWSQKADTLVSRFSAASAVANNRLYVFGGIDYAANPAGVTASVESYDPATNTWTLHAPMPFPRVSAAAVAVNGRIYVVGGYGTSILDSVVVYDPTADTWSDGPALNTARINPGAAAIDDRVYAFAGYNGDAYSPSSHFTSLEALTVSAAPPPDTGQCETDLAAAVEHAAALEAQLSACNAQKSQLQSSVESLAQQNAALSAAVSALQEQIAQLQGIASAVNTDLGAVQQDLARAFGNGAFRISGASSIEQLNNLIRAVLNLNLGRKQGVYQNLGGR